MTLGGAFRLGGWGLAGGAQAVSLAWPWSWGWPQGEPVPGLQVLAMAALVVAVQSAPSAWASVWRGWVFATAWLIGTFWWLFVSMHTYGGMAPPLAGLAVLALALALGVYYAAAAGLCWHWRSAPWWARVLVFAACWTLAEWARGTWFTGFPWGAVGYAQVDALAWLAPYVGVYGLGALAAGMAVLLASAALQLWQGRARWRALLVMGLVFTVLSPSVGRGWAEAWPEHTRSAGLLHATLLQGNIPQNEKFEAQAGVPLALTWYAQQVRAAVAAPLPADGVGLVVAPETAIPVLPQDVSPAYWQDLRDAVAQGRSAVMLGLPLGSWTKGYTNSVVSWAPDGPEHRYDKHHLVPFGEFVPPLFRWFVELMHIPLGDFRRGALGQAPFAWAGQRMAPNVCYEDLFGEELAVSFREAAQAPTVLVNVSNIAWFGDTIAIDQHRHISRMRALELQRPMLRATNTGATAAIDHRGRVLAELPRLTRDALRVEVDGRAGLTPYARWAGRWGLWPLVAACAALLLALLPMAVRRRELK